MGLIRDLAKTYIDWLVHEWDEGTKAKHEAHRLRSLNRLEAQRLELDSCHTRWMRPDETSRHATGIWCYCALGSRHNGPHVCACGVER